MGLLTGLSLAVLGVMAAPSLLLSRKPDAKGLLDKIAPYQGWFGAVCAILGAWGVVHALLNIQWLQSFPMWWITYTGTSLVELGVGLLLGLGVLKSFIKWPPAQAKMEHAVSLLAPRQGLVGLVAICCGAWCIVANFALV